MSGNHNAREPYDYQKWRANRDYELTKRKAWQEARTAWVETRHQQVFQHIAKAWKDGYDIGYKEIDDDKSI